MRALAGVVHAKGGQRRFQGQAVPAHFGQPERRRLEKVQPDLPEPFPVGLQPFVVPVRQQFAVAVAVQRGVRVIQGIARRAHEHDPAVLHHPADINRHAGIQVDGPVGGADQLAGGLVHPPDPGAQAGQRAVLHRFRPEHPGQAAAPGAPPQSQQGDQALGASRQLDRIRAGL